MARIAAVFWALIVGCDSKDDFAWSQFNADGDVLEVEVGTEGLGPPVTIDLHSSTRQHIIGQATVDPGSGPAGTRHVLVVSVGPDFDPNLPDDDGTFIERVERVSVDVDSGKRGEQSWDLRQDSAAPQTWVLQLESLGGAGEPVRTDRFTVLLWEVVPSDAPNAEAEAAR